MRTTLMIGLAASVFLGSRTSRADVMVSLATTAPDLNNLTVGQKVTFDVNSPGSAARRGTWTSWRRP